MATRLRFLVLPTDAQKKPALLISAIPCCLVNMPKVMPVTRASTLRLAWLMKPKCGCNGVCKGDIVKAITSKKNSLPWTTCVLRPKPLRRADPVPVWSNKSLSPRSAATTMRRLPKPICRCTDKGHDTVRNAIVDSKLKTFHDVANVLEWKNADGCHVCRPAINYYLVCAWPSEKVDDSRSRFINERVHANIQKDNTTALFPVCGGVTTPAELRAIADAADKYQVPHVKVTGGQRIDLLGVKKTFRISGKTSMTPEWSRSHAYGKAPRTVKTCVGSEYCRFGTQDSTGMGIALEKMTWGSWTPPVKLPLPTKLRRSHHPGFRCGCCRFRLGALCRRQRRWPCGAFLVGSPVTPGDGIRRCLHADVPRTGPTQRAYGPRIERVGLSYIKAELVDNPDQRRA